jgi:hypothetical protein
MLLTGLVLTGIGGTVGLIGIWGYVVAKLPVPTVVRVVHAHLNWWAVIAYVAALALPFLMEERWRRRITLLYLASALIWLSGMVGFYTTASIWVGGLATIAEYALGASLVITIYWTVKHREGLVGPFLKIHLLAALSVLLVGVAIGLYVILTYKLANPFFYLSTSNLRAIPTTHDHLAMIPVGSLVYVATLAMIGTY